MYTCKQIAGKYKYAYKMMHRCHGNKFRFTNQIRCNGTFNTERK